MRASPNNVPATDYELFMRLTHPYSHKMYTRIICAECFFVEPTTSDYSFQGNCL